MNKQTPLAIVGKDLPKDCESELRRHGYSIITLPSYSRLGKGVDTHADLMLFPIDDRVFMYKELIEALPEICEELKKSGYTVVPVELPPSSDYPKDIALNCLKIGNHIICKKKHIAPEIEEYAQARGYIVSNTNQGYARCTACPIGEGALITADPSISKTAKDCGFDILQITEGSISLRCHSHGFIGGTCGIDGNKIFFAGSLSAHPDGEEIKKFCHSHNVTPISLSPSPLTDVGSIFFL